MTTQAPAPRKPRTIANINPLRALWARIRQSPQWRGGAPHGLTAAGVTNALELAHKRIDDLSTRLATIAKETAEWAAIATSGTELIDRLADQNKSRIGDLADHDERLDRLEQAVADLQTLLAPDPEPEADLDAPPIERAAGGLTELALARRDWTIAHEVTPTGSRYTLFVPVDGGAGGPVKHLSASLDHLLAAAPATFERAAALDQPESGRLKDVTVLGGGGGGSRLAGHNREAGE